MLLNWSTFSFTKKFITENIGGWTGIQMCIYAIKKNSRQQKNNQIYLYYDGWFAMEVCDVVAALKNKKKKYQSKTKKRRYMYFSFLFFYYQNQINSFRLPPRMRFVFLNVFYMFSSSSSFLLYGLVFHKKMGGRRGKKKNI